MEARDRISGDEWQQAWEPLLDSLFIPICKLVDEGAIPQPGLNNVGVFTDTDGKRYIVPGKEEAWERAFKQWMGKEVWKGLAYGGIRASDYLPADSEAVRKGLWVACCSNCTHAMWAEAPQGGKPGARHCSVCLAGAEREKKRRQRGTDLSPRACACCGATFTPKRTDARFCSGACRAKASRQANT